MCGHVGVFTKYIVEGEKKIFNDLLFLDVLRGEDSTGVAIVSGLSAVKPEAHYEVFKSIGCPSNLFQEHGSGLKKRTLSHRSASLMMGHNRFATQGGVSTDTAHPFDFPNLIGAHNGTVSQSSLKDFTGYKDFNVDSQIIFAHLDNTMDIDKVWKDADGAMALVWWDKTTNTLNLARNKERDLHFVYSKTDATLFWASEQWMLYVACSRNNMDINDVVQVVPNKHYKFVIGKDGKVSHTTSDIAPFIPKPLPKHNYSNNVYGRYSGGMYNDWDDWETRQQQRNEPPAKSTKPTIQKGCVKNLEFELTEFVDHENWPHAFGKTKDGDIVRINITTDQELAKNKIIGRGTKKGYYLASKAYGVSGAGTNNYFCQWGDVQWFRYKPATKTAERTELTKADIEPATRKSVHDDYAHWYDTSNFLTKNGWLDRTTCGCDVCKHVPLWGERNDITWLDKEQFFCKDCSGTDLVKEVLQLAYAEKRA